MTTTQKVIKYLSLAFAIAIIASIASGIIYSLGFISGIFNRNESAITDSMTDVNISVTMGDSLRIDLITVSLTIKTGDVFDIQTNSKYITGRQTGNTCVIEEKRRSWFNTGERGSLVITVPKDFEFNEIEIDSGAGVVKIDDLIAERIDLDIGAGEVEINNLVVLNKADIDGGAGKATIRDGRINNLDFDMGVGEVNITAEILGKSEMDCGVGKTDITLKGGLSDYRIFLEKGIGSATLEGEEMRNKTYYGTGDNRIEINSGVGSVTVRFKADDGTGNASF